MSKKKTNVLVLIILLSYAVVGFWIGYFIGQNKTEQLYNSYPVARAIKLLDSYYIIKFSPEELNALQHVAIKAILQYLDPYSYFFPPLSAKSYTSTSRSELIEKKIIDNNIGYIKVPRFISGKTYLDIKQTVVNFNQQNIQGLIIDLRDNPGGDATETIKTANLFLEKGKIIITFKFRSPYPEEIYYAKEKNIFDKPVVILINGNSASASEIFSGALRDNKRAVLVGTKTFGKGCGQEIFSFDDGSMLGLTAFKFYLPGGTCPQGIGIEPDIIVDDATLQLDKAIEILKSKISPAKRD